MELLLGIGREIITPEIGCNLYGYTPDTYSETLHDDLTATAYAFTYGEQKAMLISITVGSLMTGHGAKLRKQIQERTGISADHIILSATHTHTGPILESTEGWGSLDEPYYYNIFVPGVLKAAETAWKNREPVTMGWAVDTSYVGINRRELRINNKIALGQNKWGPFDPRMSILSFKNRAGKIVGNIISYGCHGTAAGRATAISRDWSGLMTDGLEAHTGGITAFFNDTIGDVGPRLSNGRTTGDMSYVEELGKVAAADAIRIFEKIDTYEEVSVAACSDTLRIPVEPRMAYETAVQGYDPELEKNAINLVRKKLSFLRRVIESYEAGYQEISHKEISQVIIRVGRFAFTTFPYELFSVVGLRIKQEVQDLAVLTLSLANGSEGYFATQDQVCRGGYEIDSFKTGSVQPYPDDADFALITETLRNLENLKRS